MAASKLVLRKQRRVRDKDAALTHIRQRTVSRARRQQKTLASWARPTLVLGRQRNAVGRGAPEGQPRARVPDGTGNGPGVKGCDAATARRSRGGGIDSRWGGEWLVLVKRRGGRVRHASLGRRWAG